MNYWIKKSSDTAYKDFMIDFGLRVFETKGIGEEKVKPYYKYSWIDENGIDVYIPQTAVVEATPISVRGWIHNSTANYKLQQLKDFLKSNGVLTYKDNVRGVTCNVVYDGMSIEVDRYRDDVKFIQIKIDFTNIEGVFNYNLINNMVQINNKDDFQIQTILKDIDGVPIDVTGVNWKLWYYVSASKVYEASHIGGVYTNCSVDVGKINIFINGFDWGNKGILMKRAFVSWNDTDFSDGTQDVSTIAEQTNIEII